MLTESNKKYFEAWCKGVRGEDNLVSVPINTDIEDLADRTMPFNGWSIEATSRFMEELNELTPEMRECVVANISVMKYARYPITMGKGVDWVYFCDIGRKSIVYDFEPSYGKITLYWIDKGSDIAPHVVTPKLIPEEDDCYEYTVERARSGENFELQDMQKLLCKVRNDV